VSSAAPPVPAVPSYASGISDLPLLGDTIGDNLDRTAGISFSPRCAPESNTAQNKSTRGSPAAAC
jgi:fatty-acyl-CoA synthase